MMTYEEYTTPTEPIIKEQFYKWITTSTIVDRWSPYHDAAGGIESAYLIEKDGFRYKLVEFNMMENKQFVWYYRIAKLRKCYGQNGEGI